MQYSKNHGSGLLRKNNLVAAAAAGTAGAAAGAAGRRARALGRASRVHAEVAFSPVVAFHVFTCALRAGRHVLSKYELFKNLFAVFANIFQ